MENQKIFDRQELIERLEAVKKEGQKVVFTNGCFDILHVGHVRYLQAARELGDFLVIGVNTDASVQKLKGQSRPIVPEEERAEMLSALECVSYVTIFNEDTPIELISALKPDIHVKGGDYTVESLPESKVILSYGGEVVIMPTVEGKSTTNIIKQIADTNN